MKIKRIAYFILPLLFFLYLFAIYDTGFNGPDKPIHFAYTASLVDDGDLNIVNQVYAKLDKFSVSKTYNLPDFHNHGGAILWAPFYIYAKSIYTIAVKLNLKDLTICGFDRLAKCAMSFSTVVFGFLSLIFTYKLTRVFFSNRIALWSTLMIFFGTPFFYFTVYETGNANIVASLFSILSIWFLSFARDMKRSRWFLYGLFFAICITVKIDLWFQVFFIFFIFIMLLILRQANWRNGICFLVGLMPGLILKTVNDYIKYGALRIGELGMLNLKDTYIFDQLLSPYRGFCYTSPVAYICLLGVIFLVINLMKNIKAEEPKKITDTLFILFLALYLFIKIIFLGYRYAWGGGTCGMRPLLVEFPVFVLLYACAFRGQKKYIKYFLGVASVFFILWNWLVISEYIAGVDLKYVAAFPRLCVRIKALRHILQPLFYIKDLHLKLMCCLPLLLAAGFWYARNQNGRKPFYIFTLLTIYLYTSYAGITALNIYNNKKNVKWLRADGFFENAKIVSPNEFEKEENVGSMNEMIEYFGLRNNIDRVSRIKRYKKEIYGEGEK